MVPVFYSPRYVGSHYAFDTTRKAQWLAESLQAQPIAGISLQPPQPVEEQLVTTVHEPRYVHAIISGVPRALAESQGFPCDAELWPMVAMSTGGVLAAAMAARMGGIAGSLSSGLHHARGARGAGFCTINGLALAAKAARMAGARVVLILDLDAHCGGGTASLIADDPHIWQLDIATDHFDAYRSAPTSTLDIVRDATTYLPFLHDRLAALELQADQIDLCLYNAGMDPDSRCAVGGLAGITPALLAERERLVFGWCRARHVPIAFVLAGGYIGTQLTIAELVALHRLTLQAAAAT